MSEVKRYDPVFDAQEIYQLEGDVVFGADFDRVTAERDALQVSLNAVTFNLDKTDKVALALQQRLTAADERVDVLSPGSALGDVHLERLRQIDVENRSPVDDDDYSLGQLAYAAAGYTQGSVPAQQVQGCLRPSYWPWHPRWWKPGSPRRMLVKAAALILAEIERIDRAALKPADPPLPEGWYGVDCEQDSQEPGFSVNVLPAAQLGSGACLSSYGHRGVSYELASRPMTFVSMSDHKCPKKSYAVKAITRGVKHPCGILVNGVIYYCAECKK